MEDENEKRMQDILDEMLDAGIRKLAGEQFRESLLIPMEPLSVQEMVDRYGYVLTKEDVAKLKELFPEVNFDKLNKKWN